MSSLKYLFVIPVLVALLAYFYPSDYDYENDMNERLQQILSGLLRAEKKIAQPKAKIAIGFGGCQDMFVDGLALLDALKFEAPENPEHFMSVDTQQELTKMMAYFFQHGAAAERYVGNDTLFNQLTRVAKTIPGYREAIGGNAPAMAQRLAQEGAEVLLAAKLSNNARKAMHSSLHILGDVLEEDDIHLILEYKTGDKWGKFTSPRANRFIVHSDNSNPLLETVDDLEKEILKFDPSVLVVGGLQMMDNFPFQEGQMESRLGKLRSLLATLPRKINTHFEMASFSDPALLQKIISTVVEYSDSLGMNEQELPNLVSILQYGNVSLLSDAHPRVASVLDQMRQVYKLLKNTKEVDGKRKLTRLHVHTLAYQAILTTKGSPWKNTMSATAKASLTAHRHVCGSNWIHTQKSKLLLDDSFSSSISASSTRIPVHEKRPVSCWDEDDYQICVAPVLVCTQVKQTAGGGDNISSAGLLVQVN
ncbi:ADP-dependent glucokinase-like [Mytilus edulis]|uniref:ADPGK n=1 Tax=Mytilus edulis TaxID=6550 RepID=A0A8S3THE2_MYTED|nr:ADPGK [Mytilus edulis]